MRRASSPASGARTRNHRVSPRMAAAAQTSLTPPGLTADIFHYQQGPIFPALRIRGKGHTAFAVLPPETTKWLDLVLMQIGLILGTARDQSHSAPCKWLPGLSAYLYGRKLPIRLFRANQSHSTAGRWVLHLLIRVRSRSSGIELFAVGEGPSFRLVTPCWTLMQGAKRKAWRDLRSLLLQLLNRRFPSEPKQKCGEPRKRVIRVRRAPPS